MVNGFKKKESKTKNMGEQHATQKQINRKSNQKSNTIDQITFRAIFTNIVAFKFARSTIHARSTV